MSDIKLPEPFDTIFVLHEHGDLEDVPVYTAEQMQEYAKQAAELERERCAGLLMWLHEQEKQTHNYFKWAANQLREAK